MSVSGVTLIGQKELLARLSVYNEKMTKEVARALKDSGDEIVRVALPLTPLDTGELRARSFNDGPLEFNGSYHQVVGYERHDRNYVDQYAVKVHEDLTARHSVGQAKYLEEAVNITAPKIGKYLAAKLGGVKP